jgi:group I intron endonuclease
MKIEESNERMQLSGVYCIKCIVNGKVYVGSAIKFKQRIGEHIRTLKAGIHHSKYVQRAWKKHGPESFRFFILEVTTSELLISCEQKWIDELQAANREYGYNSCPIAGNRLGMRHTAESRAKMSASGIGRIFTLEHRARIASATRNRSVEVRAKVSASNAARTYSAETRAKIGFASRNRSAESNAKISVAKTGKSMPNDTREKISIRMKARLADPNIKAKWLLNRLVARVSKFLMNLE